MNKVNVAGLKIDSMTKQEVLTVIQERMTVKEKTFIITPYSEFLYHSLRDPKLLDIFNKADISVPDGIGIFWAAKFLQIPFTAKSFYGKILQAFWQVMWTLGGILFHPFHTTPSANASTPPLNTSLRQLADDREGGEHSAVDLGSSAEQPSNGAKHSPKEKIPGSELIWDLAKLAAQNNWSIYLLGGFGDTSKLVARRLEDSITQKDGRRLLLYWSNKNPDDPTIIDDIKKTNPEMVFVAFGPIKQEKWIVENMDKLPAKFYIGLGGTFDYIAGKRLSPPKFIRSIGLEWLYRLITQPYRLKRIFSATIGLITALIRYKVFMSMPYRPNVVSVILNPQNEVLICKRNSEGDVTRKFGYPENYFNEHWQMPQGGMDKNETIEKTAKREAFEEAGLKDLEYIKTSPKTSSYIWANANRKLFWNAPYKGQEQRLAYLRYYGNNSDVKIDNWEFVDYKWVPVENLHKELHPQRLHLAQIVQEDLIKPA
jgi:N-acetylglucosaminyldiphosphoundecaprenol N-acetyl-beta-D-mannosaminyltransferase